MTAFGFCSAANLSRFSMRGGNFNPENSFHNFPKAAESLQETSKYFSLECETLVKEACKYLNKELSQHIYTLLGFPTPSMTWILV